MAVAGRREELVYEVLSSWVHVIRCIVVGILGLRGGFMVVAGEEGGL